MKAMLWICLNAQEDIAQSAAGNGEDARVMASPRSAAGDLDAWVGACAKLNTGSTIEDVSRYFCVFTKALIPVLISR